MPLKYGELVMNLRTLLISFAPLLPTTPPSWCRKWYPRTSASYSRYEEIILIDSNQRFAILSPVYSHAFFASVHSKMITLVILNGYPGVGKSSVGKELR